VKALHIAFVGHVAGDDIQSLLAPGQAVASPGYAGAPLMGVLIGELLRQGHRVTAITSDSTLPLDGGPQYRHGAGFSYVATPARRRAWRPNGLRLGRAVDFFAFEIGQIARAVDACAPDIVHAHWSYEMALGAMRQDRPILVTCHDSPRQVLRYSRNLYRSVRYLMARRVFAKGREFSAVSRYLADELRPYLAEAPEVIPNPVADYVFAAGAGPRQLPGTRRIGLICNGWGRRKNAEPALAAFARWRRSEPRAELHVYGDDFGPGERAQRWSLGRCLAAGMHFHGRLPHRALVESLATMDALLHPALEETFGVVLAEAMALGLPVVAGRSSGAVPDVMAGDAQGRSPLGLLVDVSRVDDIVGGLDGVFDTQYAARSRAGIERAREHYSTASVVRSYVDRYHRILAKESPCP